MILAGKALRTLAVLSPLLLAFACTTQNSASLDDGLKPRSQASFAATTRTSETTVTDTSERATAFASPAGEEEALAPAFAQERAANTASNRKLVQVASLDSADPLPGVAKSGQLTLDQARDNPRRANAYRFSSRDHECLARAMFFESNRSSREGLIAVGSVVMNRLESGRWGNSVCQVVGAPRQFAPGVLSRRMDSRALPDVMDAAEAVLKGERHPKIYDEVMYFHTAGYRFRYNNMHYVAVAGGNSFYEKRRRMRGQRNTSQNVVMAQARKSRAESAAEPVRTAFAEPAEAQLQGAMADADSAQETVMAVPTPRPDSAAANQSQDIMASPDGSTTVTASKTGRVKRPLGIPQTSTR